MSNDRRRFLGWLGGTSLLGIASVPSLPSALAASPPPVQPPHAAHPAPVSETWDVSWTDRVKGDHRAVFDSPQLADGAALFRAVAWCDHYKEVYGVERSAMSPVLVLRHGAIDLVVNDEYWCRFRLGKEHKMKGATGKWVEANPLTVKPASATAGANTPAATDDKRDKYTLERFIADGGIVLACSWAFGQVAGRIRKEEKIEQAAATERAKGYLIPGVILQPNGIFAALRAQEAGCHYVMAS